MIRVSITEALKADPTARHFATLLARCLSNISTSPLLGARGGFERNRDSVAAGIEKFHVRMPGDDPWPNYAPMSRRTSNNFLVFARHFYNDEYFQILAIVSPSAHQRIDAMLPAIIELAESTFIEISDDELEALDNFTI
ncbi:type II toxin-antitoxin system YafO family toxin [Serratia fonticola]|uniref:type II toxin-antitoxin system YafO family toxin n=1 Tax=Serratia fonticola TaxID=47917 RepID=UPI003AAF8ABE